MSLDVLVQENEGLRKQLSERDERLAERDGQLAEHAERIAELESQLDVLARKLQLTAKERKLLERKLEELRMLRRRHPLLDPGQGVLAFDDGMPKVDVEEQPEHACEAPDGETPADSIRQRHKPKQPARRIDTSNLPVEHVYHELAAEERVCQVTGRELVAVDEKLEDEIRFEPGVIKRVVHHRVVYGLSEEDAQERQAAPITAPGPVRPLENSIAGPSLLAWILVQKYARHLPLYRQETILAQHGLRIPRQRSSSPAGSPGGRLEGVAPTVSESKSARKIGVPWQPTRRPKTNQEAFRIVIPPSEHDGRRDGAAVQREFLVDVAVAVGLRQPVTCAAVCTASSDSRVSREPPAVSSSRTMLRYSTSHSSAIAAMASEARRAAPSRSRSSRIDRASSDSSAVASRSSWLASSSSHSRKRSTGERSSSPGLAKNSKHSSLRSPQRPYGVLVAAVVAAQAPLPSPPAAPRTTSTEPSRAPVRTPPCFHPTHRWLPAAPAARRLSESAGPPGSNRSSSPQDDCRPTPARDGFTGRLRPFVQARQGGRGRRRRRSRGVPGTLRHGLELGMVVGRPANGRGRTRRSVARADGGALLGTRVLMECPIPYLIRPGIGPRGARWPMSDAAGNGTSAGPAAGAQKFPGGSPLVHRFGGLPEALRGVEIGPGGAVRGDFTPSAR